jgi:hypothetical protein
LYVIGDCSGLYVSNGENYSTVPSQQYTRTTWLPVELGQPFQHAFRLMVNVPRTRTRESVPLLRTGQYVATAITVPVSPKVVYMTFSIGGGPKTVYAGSFLVSTGTTHTVFVTTDPVKHLMSVQMDGVVRISATYADDHVDVASLPSPSQAGPGTLLVDRLPTPRPDLCLSLVH